MLRPSTTIPGRGAASDLRALALIVLIALLLAAGMSDVLNRSPPSTGFVVTVGIGLAGTVALALLRYEAAVALGFVLFGVALTEPAPSDARRALSRLLGDERARRELGHRARAWALEHLGWDASVARYEDVYRSLLGAARGGG